MFKRGLVALGAFGATLASGQFAVSYEDPEEGLHPTHYLWDFQNPFKYYDVGSIRRGHQVYKQICATCHSMQYLRFRHLINVCYTEAEIKEMAAEYEYEDGPNDEGEMYERPGRFTDRFPSPYTNENLARFANNGAVPPDLTNIVKARHGGQDYLFALLTGYKDPPAGVEVKEGMSYNPYFKGGLIAMPQQITDGCIDYEDGTPNTASQIAKDATYFFVWASYPDHDERMNLFWRATTLGLLMLLPTIYYKRYRWSPLKSRRIVVDTLN